jgi:hypothetical protein
MRSSQFENVHTLVVVARDGSKQRSNTRTHFVLTISNKQFSDLRSQIVKEAAVTMSAMAARLQLEFAPLALVLLPPAMRVLKSSKGVMYNASAAAISSVVTHCAHSDVLALMIRATEDKHPAIREHAVRFCTQRLAADSMIAVDGSTLDALQVSD